VSAAFIPSEARKVEQRFTVEEEPYGYEFSPGAGMLRLMTHKSDRHGDWWSGDFVDYRGIVSIQMEQKFTRLDAVANGRCHTRSWRRAYGDRTVAKLCRAFLTDLLGAPASADRNPQGGDAQQAPSRSDESAVPKADAQTPSPNLSQGDTP
jgi:hypothetical protein